MKTIAIIISVLLFHIPALAQILPNTSFCIKGSDAKPTQYCADVTPCKAISGPNGDHTVCLVGASNPPEGALTHTSNCWSRTTDYTCMQFTTNCGTYSSDSNCTEIGSKECTKDGESNLLLAVNPKIGKCSSYTRSFSCVDPRKNSSSSYTTTRQCETNSSQNGLDWSTQKESRADDFVQAATSQEFARQLAKYGQKDGVSIDNLFGGVQLGCRDGSFGLKACCKSKGGGAVTDNSLAKKVVSQAAAAAFQKGAGYAIEVGSVYVYSTIYSSAPAFMQAGITDILARGQYNTLGTGFSMFGIAGSAEAAGGAFFGGASSMAIGNSGLYFNPYAFAAALAIQIVMEVISCNQNEMDLANARKENLCHYVGNYCSQKIMILGFQVGCNETTQSFCCYSGLLGLAIAEGAHSQLGLSWGTPKDPICKGFTPEQISNLDMNTPAMATALAPFKQMIMKSYLDNAGTAISSGTVGTAINDAAAERAKNLCLQRKKFDATTEC